MNNAADEKKIKDLTKINRWFSPQVKMKNYILAKILVYEINQSSQKRLWPVHGVNYFFYPLYPVNINSYRAGKQSMYAWV